MEHKTARCNHGHLRTPENTWPGGRCKLCSKRREVLGKNKAWKRTDSGKRSIRFSALKCRYGITLEQYEAMLKKQHGDCAICGVKLDSSKKTLIPAVDHVHDESKHVRGLLCGRCNSAIGLLNEDPEVMLKAIQYLKETQ